MRKYTRPVATLYVRKRRSVYPQKHSFFRKFLVRFVGTLFILAALFVGGRYIWRLVAKAQLADWHVKTVVVSGITGPHEQALLKQTAGLAGTPFSGEQADQLEDQLSRTYPMFKEVDVDRGLFSGKLTIEVQPRRAVARFILPDQSYKYLDDTSTVYDDVSGPQGLLQIELSGDVPAQLPPSLVEWVEGILKLQKSLPFEGLELTVPAATVTMRLTDQSVIHFGQADHLKDKVARAVQILNSARSAYTGPFTLDFTYFDQGQVFLTHSSH